MKNPDPDPHQNFGLDKRFAEILCTMYVNIFFFFANVYPFRFLRNPSQFLTATAADLATLYRIR